MHADLAGRIARLSRLRWWMWAVGALIYYGVLFERTSLGAIADRLLADFSVGAGSLGTLAAMQLVTYTVMQVPTGALADSWGPRRVLTLGALLAGLGTLLFSLAPVFSLAVGGRMLLGLGDALVFLNVLRLQAEWFRPREYATLAGLTAFAAGLGGMTATAPLAQLVEAFGWRTPLAVSGLVLLGVAVVCWLVVRDRPSDLGLPAWSELEAPPSAGEVVARSADDTLTPSTRGASARGSGLAAAMRVVGSNPQTWWAALSHLGLFASYLALVLVWGIPYLMQVHGLSRGAAGAILALAPLSYLVSGPTLGFLSDRIGSRRAPMLAVEVVLVLVWLGLAFGQALPLLVIAVLIFAGGVGAGTCLLAFASAKESNPADYSGLATGITNLGGFAGGALLQVAVGLLLDLHWAGREIDGARVYPPEAYRLAFLALLASTLVGIVGTLRLRETAPRRP